MTADEFREQLGCLIADTKPLALKAVLEVLLDEIEMLRDEIERKDADG